MLCTSRWYVPLSRPPFSFENAQHSGHLRRVACTVHERGNSASFRRSGAARCSLGSGHKQQQQHCSVTSMGLWLLGAACLPACLPVTAVCLLQLSACHSCLPACLPQLPACYSKWYVHAWDLFN